MVGAYYEKSFFLTRTMNNAPIGVFDSGSGGLSVLSALERTFPHESFIYFGDHANTPYGGKTSTFIQSRVLSVIDYLLSRHCKLIVIACNTATIAGIDIYRKKFPDLPIVGVVPVIKTAAMLSKTKQFIVLSTDYTAKSDYQKDLIRLWASDCRVTSIGSSKLVPLIEKGILDGPEIIGELKNIFHRVPNTRNDVIVIGCTHYPFIRESIQSVVGVNVQIIDSSEAVARQVARILTARNELADTTGLVQYCTTGVVETVEKVFTKLLGNKPTIFHVTV